MKKQIAKLIALGVILAGRSVAAEPWTVVGADRMDVAVVRGDVPVFVLDNRMIGPGWRGGRLNQLATVRAIYNDRSNYDTGKFGFYVHQPDLGELLEITPERKKVVDDTIWEVVKNHPYTGVK